MGLFLKRIKDDYANSADTNVISFEHLKHQFIFIYLESMTEIGEFNKFFFEKINKSNYRSLATENPGTIEVLNDTSTDHISNCIYNGMIVFAIDEKYFYKVNLQKKPLRSISSSVLDPLNLFASQDGFIEDAKINIALVRKRLKTNDLIVKRLEIGEKGKNIVYITCLKEHDKHLAEVVERINSITPDVAISINTISGVFQVSRFMPTVLNTGSPETFCHSLSQGRIGVILDNSPTALIVPVNLSYFSTMKDEIGTPGFYAIPTRIFMLIFFIISIFILGLFMAIVNYHTNTLTLSLLVNIKLTERGTTLPMFLEIIIILLLFEFYRFASSRSSSTYVQNIIVILGGLFIGQNAVNSGLIGALVLLVTALCYLASYAFSNNPHLITALSIMRLFILVASYMFGLYGFFTSSVIVVTYLCSINSFDLSYLYPASPISIKGIKSFFKPRIGGDK